MNTNAYDLLSIIQQDTYLKRASSHRGGEYHGPCPFCGGTDRFRVQPEEGRWVCRQCGQSGDAIAYLVETGRMTKAGAYKARHGDMVNIDAGNVTSRLPRPPAACDPPSGRWQARAWDFIVQSQTALWSAIGSKALSWLTGRGLNEETILRSGLGYHTGQLEYEDRAAWGLPEELNEKGNPKKVWLPRGVVIPWFIGDDIWRVNIRRPVGDPKYIGPAGWGNALYDTDQLTSNQPAILVEGELDALTLKQHAGDLVTPVATGSTDGARRARWLAKLALCPRVLVAFDADKAGEDARRYWLSVLPNGRYWRPFWGDANGIQQDGVDLRAWVLAGLGNEA